MTEEIYKSEEFEETGGSVSGNGSEIMTNDESLEKSEEHQIDGESDEFGEEFSDNKDHDENEDQGNLEEPHISKESPEMEEPKTFRVLSYDDFTNRES